MRRITHIARNELYTLFYSPIAWLLLIVFLVLTSADYIYVTGWGLESYEKGGQFLMYTQNLTSLIVSNPYLGYFPKIVRNLYIFFPLITMGLISREISSGTIKLLYSSPITIAEIVLGKFLAALYFALCFVVLLIFTLIGLSLSIAHPDFGQIAIAVFGIFLVLSAYAAIGLFISSLTSYQIVAAIITLGVFAFFSNVGGLWQEIDFVRGITFYMDIAGKSSNFTKGLLNLRDFTYFLLIILSFLSFTIIRIKSATESVSNFKKAMRYIAVIAITAIIGYVTNKPSTNVYFDATRFKINTITPVSQAMITKLNEGDLEITVFANLFDPYFGSFFTPDQRNKIIANLWEPYIRFKPDIRIHFINYYDADTSSYYVKLNPGKSLQEIAEKEVKIYGMNIDNFLNPKEVNRMVDTKTEDFRNFFQLRYKGKTAIVRTFEDPEFWPGEDEIAATINRLIAEPPKIAFLSDEIERGPFSSRPRDYRTVSSRVGYRLSLINQGYDFDTISLKHKAIPQGITALVIADPRTEFSFESLAKINDYVDAGGNLFLAVEPDRKEISNSLLAKLGLALHKGILIQPNNKYSSDCAFAELTAAAENMSPQSVRYLRNDLKYYGDTVFRVAMVGAGYLDIIEKKGFRINPLLRTNELLSWNRLTPINKDSLQLLVKKLPGDEHGSFVTALRMQRNINGRDQQIIVSGDADYLSKTELDGENPTRYNMRFGFWCFSIFTYGNFPPNTLRPESLDSSFKIKSSGFPIQKFIYYWIIPASIALICSIILFRRKRK